MYQFNSIASLDHFIKHYGIVQHDECCFGDGVVILHGKQIAKYCFAKQSGMPIFEFEDEYYNQRQKDNREQLHSSNLYS